jgi:twitching motility protein PilT
MQPTIDLPQILHTAADRKASDIFFKAGSPPVLRINGAIVPFDGQITPLTDNQVRELAYSIMTEDQIAHFEAHHEQDLAFTLPNVSRFRVNVYQQRGTVGIVLRLIDLRIKSIDELLLPPVLKDVAKQRQGLILVTGPTGCGKSTTLAAMIDLINQTRRCNIVTIEDPIEYVHPDRRSIVNQREVGIDTESFHVALRAIVRQSPDIILIGEMRDQITFDVAVTAAETGHLVFSTVHTSSASETLDRVVNMFPPHIKTQICQRLAVSLRSVISQKLVPKKDGSGRVPAVEVMVVTPTIAGDIEEAKFGDVYDKIRDGSFWGMQTLNQALDRLVKEGVVAEAEALARAGNLTELKQMLRRKEGN